MREKSEQTKAEMPSAQNRPSELKDEELNQAQGGLGIKRSGRDDPKRQARSTVQDTIAIGDNLVSIEADPV